MSDAPPGGSPFWRLLSAIGEAHAQARRDVTVFAAASLTNAMQDVGAAFTSATGVKAKLSFAASSTLARQIEAGAGAQLFVSADEQWMDYLDKRDLLEPASRRCCSATGWCWSCRRTAAARRDRGRRRLARAAARRPHRDG